MSIVPGTSSTDLYVFKPSISDSWGLIGITVYPSAVNARSALFPNFFRSLDAPTTATTLATLHYRAGRPDRRSTSGTMPASALRLSLRPSRASSRDVAPRPDSPASLLPHVHG